MKKKIYKYKLNEDNPLLTMPDGADIVHIDQKDSEIYVWALVDPAQPLVRRYFKIIGTGEEIENDGLLSIHTIFIGPFVWHVCEVLAFNLASSS